MKNEDVAEQFVNGHETKVKSMFSEKANYTKLVLYSYGYHFPMCVKLQDGTFLFNGDGYSQTTSRHKGEIARALGYDNFKDLSRTETQDKILTTEKLKSIISNNQINSYADFLANKI